MTNEEIIEEVREDLINLLNCTDDVEMKAKLKTILQDDIVERCRCPMCGEKFDPRKNIKHSKRIL